MSTQETQKVLQQLQKVRTVLRRYGKDSDRLRAALEQYESDLVVKLGGDVYRAYQRVGEEVAERVRLLDELGLSSDSDLDLEDLRFEAELQERENAL